ncbi:MAG: M14 family metallopeptidase [Blautia sp.]|nr:M14 family metallopeptidase [Blautia sp.]MDY5031260.1 M14 family metallopeptidase [Blautia sp.]
MRTEVIYENRSLYRDDFKIMGYVFGEGEKSVCIVGNMRGNEYQQLYACSQLIQTLKRAEKEGRLAYGHQILVIPSANPYSMNVGKRFWPIDNTDINRMFPGYMEGETTQRIAGGIFEKISDYPYGIQFASNYMPGEFMPYVNIMKTDLEYVELAKKFGMPYVVRRTPRPYDTTTLNYNWQIWETRAFSLYTTTTDRINRDSARRGVEAVMMFLDAIGVVKNRKYKRYLSQIIDDREIVSVRTTEAGFFEPLVETEEEVKKGQPLARILNPLDGEELECISAPVDGIVFFRHSDPLTYGHTAVIKLIAESSV